jgi:soluble lytic murein transglycosylase-like protein
MPYYVHPHLYFPLRYYAAKYAISADLCLAVVNQESFADPNAVGDERHSFGLMQEHVEGAGAGYRPADLLSIPRNLEIGIAYLADMIQKTGTVEDGLSAYNQGLGAWQKKGRAANLDYVKSVLAYRDAFRLKGWDWDHDRVLIRFGA